MNKLEIEKAGSPYLFRYRSNNDFTIDEIENNYIYFPNSEKLNDPFDSSHRLIRINEDPALIDESMEFFKTSLEKDLGKNYFEKKFQTQKDFLNFVKKGIIDFVQQTGIACFSISPVHMMLWANYANNHQGICIQYNTNLDKTFFDNLGVVEYVDNLKILDYSIGVQNESNAMRQIFFTKLKLWREEYEIRLVKSPPAKHILKKEAIRSVVFGLRTPSEFQKNIIETVSKYNPAIQLFQSALMTDGIGLTLTKIEIL